MGKKLMELVKKMVSVEDIRKRVAKAQKNYSLNIDIIEDILIRERGYVFREPIEKDVVVLCSGGLDSMIMIDMIIKQWDSKVHPLFFRRGAKAEKLEEKAFDFFMDFYDKKYPEKVGEPLKLDYYITPKELKGNMPKEILLTTGYPLRNATMQNIAVMYATSLDENIDTIVSGAVGDDNTEPDSGVLGFRSQTLNTCMMMGDWKWQITSFLTEPTMISNPQYKADLIEYAMEEDLPLEKTRTCFTAEGIACGECSACQKRLIAFEAAGYEDPVGYKTRVIRDE